MPLPSTSGSIDCDVLIAGAGPAGCGAARSLAQRGLRVILVDQRSFPRDKVCGDGLISGLTEFEILRQGITRVSDFQYGPNYVWVTFRIAPDAQTGPVVIRASNGSEAAMLTGALRVLAPVEQGIPPGGRKRPVSGK